MTLGSILAPNDAWLMIRGLRTLAIRMQRIAETSAEVLAFLEAHPKVRRVHSPRATGNAQLDLTERQLRVSSGLMTIELDAPTYPRSSVFAMRSNASDDGFMGRLRVAHIPGRRRACAGDADPHAGRAAVEPRAAVDRSRGTCGTDPGSRAGARAHLAQAATRRQPKIPIANATTMSTSATSRSVLASASASSPVRTRVSSTTRASRSGQRCVSAMRRETRAA